MKLPRVVSLLPSATEIICALGLRDALVGCSHECDFPVDLPKLPALTKPRLNIAGTSMSVHEDVESLLRQGLSVFEVDAVTLRRLAPDFIVTQAQCDVCAVTPDDLEYALASFTGEQPELISLSPCSLQDVWDSFDLAADALGVRDARNKLRMEITERIDKTKKRVASREMPTVACIEWIEPLMTAGNWVPELVQLAGGRNLFGRPSAHSSWLNQEVLLDADPDVVVIFPCGFDRARTDAEVRVTQTRSPWLPSRALGRGRVAVADGHQFFNRPGPRLVDSLEILAEILHPDLCARQGDAWSFWTG